MLICFPNTSISSRSDPWNKCSWGTFTFMHLADTFIQSDLQCIPAMHFWSVTFLQNQLWSGLFPVEATRRANAQSVAWPSGLRRCFKAQVSLGAWVQIPRCQGQLFSKTLVAAMAKQRAFLGHIRQVSHKKFHTRLCL